MEQKPIDFTDDDQFISVRYPAKIEYIRIEDMAVYQVVETRLTSAEAIKEHLRIRDEMVKNGREILP